jgi:hypothetical protein
MPVEAKRFRHVGDLLLTRPSGQIDSVLIHEGACRRVAFAA